MNQVIRRSRTFAFAIAAVAFSGLAQAAWDIAIIDYPGAQSTAVGGINNPGQVAGSATYYDAIVRLPPYVTSFVYDTNKHTYTSLPQPPGYFAQAFAISDPGVIVGTATTDLDFGSSVGFVLNKGAYTLFSHPCCTDTVVRGISNTGLVTGFAFNGSPTSARGFIYDPASNTFTGITFPDGNVVYAQGINGRGQVVGSVRLLSNAAYQGSPPGHYGYLRERNGATTLFRVNGLETRARGIDDAGLITGWTKDTSGVFHGYVATLPGLSGYQVVSVPAAQIFEVPGEDSTAPQAVDNSGRVVGFYADVNGDQHSFIATPPKK